MKTLLQLHAIASFSSEFIAARLPRLRVCPHSRAAQASTLQDGGSRAAGAGVGGWKCVCVCVRSTLRTSFWGYPFRDLRLERVSVCVRGGAGSNPKRKKIHAHVFVLGILSSYYLWEGFDANNGYDGTNLINHQFVTSARWLSLKIWLQTDRSRMYQNEIQREEADVSAFFYSQKSRILTRNHTFPDTNICSHFLLKQLITFANFLRKKRQFCDILPTVADILSILKEFHRNSSISEIHRI